jgi:hypothetical protein
VDSYTDIRTKIRVHYSVTDVTNTRMIVNKFFSVIILNIFTPLIFLL